MTKLQLDVKYRNRLKALMADEGFRSMEALANETGISKNMLYMFERGETDMSLSNVLRLLWVFNCSLDDLIQYEVTSNEPTSTNDLSDETKREIEEARAEYKALKQRKKTPA